MYPRLMLLALLFCLLPLPGCGDGTTTPAPPTVTGNWSGSQEGIVVTATLAEQAGGNVTGSGMVTIPGAPFPIPFQVQGRHEHPAINLNLAAAGVENATFSGTMTNETTITGTLSAAPIGSVPMTLQRIQ